MTPARVMGHEALASHSCRMESLRGILEWRVFDRGAVGLSPCHAEGYNRVENRASVAKHRSDGHEAPSSTLSMMALMRLEAEGQRWQRNCRLSIVKNVRLKKQDLVKPRESGGAIPGVAPV